MRIIIVSVLLLMLFGCSTLGEYSFGYPFAWKQWTYNNKKPTTTKRQKLVENNMLSCGFSSSKDNTEMRANDINNYIRASQCMESRGFKHLIYSKGICTHEVYQNQMACAKD